jgi:hypothetical protein
MARGRKPIPVTLEGLQEAIVNVEWDGPLTSRNALWQAVAATPYAKKIGLSSQVAMVKAKAFGTLCIQTPLGQRGRQKGAGPVVNKQGERPQRKPKTISLEIVNQMKKATPNVYHSKINKAAKGNLKAKIHLACLQCTDFQNKEIALCTIKTCALWSSRSYQGKYKA